MSTTNSKESTPERNTGADCPICKNYRYSINDFCCKCGKRLKDTRVLVNRYAPSWHDLVCKSGHGRTKENAPDWNTGVDCTFCQNYRDIGENFCGICGKDDEETLDLFIQKIEELKAKVGIKKSIAEYGISEEAFMSTLDQMVEDAFDDQCTGANPRYPLLKEIKAMYLKAYYGEKA